MIYVRPATPAEDRELARMARQAVGRVSQRAQMVRLSTQRRPVPAIAAVFGVSRATVRFWLRRFEAAGPAGLRDEPRSGRPRKVTPQAADALGQMVTQDPQRVQAGFLATVWTVAMLGLALATTLGLGVSATTIRAALGRLRLSWHRPRLAMPRKTDPVKAAKQWAIAEAVIAAGPAAAVLYADESRLQLLPLVRACWQAVGQQLRVPTPGSNQTRALFGALNIRTGQWTYLVRQRMQKEDFLAFLAHLLVVYAEGPVLLIVDNYSSHTAHAVTEWLAAQPRLRLFYLPTYCSHLNPVEAIWLRLKDKLAADRLYGSMPLLLTTVDRFFAAMTPEQAREWAAA
ncbi:MAG TPA: IS630 family transposase [Candidatus Limnocylindrales bacterium]|nr:IS630 family transposase [Candidatus Limnocylindrales bacterium]